MGILPIPPDLDSISVTFELKIWEKIGFREGNMNNYIKKIGNWRGVGN